MTYDLEALQAALAKATDFARTADEAEHYQQNGPKLLRATDFFLYDEAVAVRTIVEAMPALLEHAAIGRALIAAAEKDGPERNLMAEVIDNYNFSRDYSTEVRDAALALIAHVKGKAHD